MTSEEQKLDPLKDPTSPQYLIEARRRQIERERVKASEPMRDALVAMDAERKPREDAKWRVQKLTLVFTIIAALAAVAGVAIGVMSMMREKMRDQHAQRDEVQNRSDD